MPILLTVLFLFLAACLAAYPILCRVNLIHNTRADADPATTTRDRLLCDQHGQTGKNFRYGFYRASHNGCEVIAVHNVKVLLGIPSTFSDTVRDFQRALAMFLFGVFGSDPCRIGAVLRREGIRYQRVGLDGLQHDGIYILSFWTKPRFPCPLHTVAAVVDGRDTRVYNLYGNGKVFPLQTDRYRDTFICAYRINNGCCNKQQPQ